jgi:hypothetical protein
VLLITDQGEEEEEESLLKAGGGESRMDREHTRLMKLSHQMSTYRVPPPHPSSLPLYWKSLTADQGIDDVWGEGEQRVETKKGQRGPTEGRGLLGKRDTEVAQQKRQQRIILTFLRRGISPALSWTLIRLI